LAGWAWVAVWTSLWLGSGGLAEATGGGRAEIASEIASSTASEIASVVDGQEVLQVLFLGDQGGHRPRERYELVAPIFQRRGIELTYTESMAEIRLENLQRYQALLVYANIDEIDSEAEQAILTYVRQGGGFVPIHSASFCFRNSAEMVRLIGAQFREHGTGVFRAELATDHPINQAYAGFESWDETYVHHRHNPENRTVLSYRVDERGREPWTWVRDEGRGRVFYTAWGHDQRTWSRPGFHNLLERGIRWAAGRDPQDAGPYLAERPFPVPQMTERPAGDPPFEYEDVGAKIPNYTPATQWGVQGENLSLMQKPLPAELSQQRFSVPAGFRVELFAAEPDLGGKPIAMAWDHRGRLWVCETVDYPNELQPPGAGRDRIRICEDTDGDWRADKFTVFAEGLSIPTAMAFWRGGVLVQNGTETLYLKDNTGDDVADLREVVYTGWELGDTHGGVSNFQYGLDNWIWAMQGYNSSTPQHGERTFQNFRQGFFRFDPQNFEVEFIRPTDNNTWGLGISEEGLIFGSTANRNPSVFMPIANRYYEQVLGWRVSLTLSSIADTHRFAPITDKVRQMDHHGGYTAGAGHALYTGRAYPREYWNRTAFVNGPTGHLVGAFVLTPEGAGFRSTSPFNLIASDDEWSAPIKTELGPDGNMWMIDWYNYIIQHNPTPHGFETGKGNAYETDLRDKVHGRIYRIVGPTADPQPISLEGASQQELVAALQHPTSLWRKHAQRLLVERGAVDVVPQLLSLLTDEGVDEIGLNVGAIHALWTLHGLGQVTGEHPEVRDAVVRALRHPSPGVRRNALQVAVKDQTLAAAIAQLQLLLDPEPQVRLAAFLALADGDTAEMGPAVGPLLLAAIADPANYADRWLTEAATSAAARHAGVFLAAAAGRQEALPPAVSAMCEIVAEHFGRTQVVGANVDVEDLLTAMAQGAPAAVAPMTRGLVAGWPTGTKIQLNDKIEADLVEIVERLPTSERGAMLQLADRWGSQRLAQFLKAVMEELLAVLDDSSAADEQRVAAAEKLASFRADDLATAQELVARITPQTPAGLAVRLVTTLGEMQAEGVGEALLAGSEAWSPAVREAAFGVMLRRAAWTTSLLSAMEAGDVLVTDLTLEQRRQLGEVRGQLRERARALLQRGGALPNADRVAVLQQYVAAAHATGDVARGKKIYADVCAKCHRHSGEGSNIGPDLTGMAVHPKEELLIHILDPNRDVESNYRMYNVQTVDGLVLAGMLSSESKTAIELVDTKGEKQSVLREDIDDFRASRISLMPEGFEKELNLEQMTDLLQFLTARGQFVPLDLSKVATTPSDRGMFYNRDAEVERLVFDAWGNQTFQGVPFLVVDPQDGKVSNAVVLRGGPGGSLTARNPREVELPCQGKVKAIHFLSGVSGWGFPYAADVSVSLIVRLEYADGTTEDHPLNNGEHFADYIRRVDVEKSVHAFDLGGRQIRYFNVVPGRAEALQSLKLVKGPDGTAPVVMAITVESAQ
jgi:putative membrane-bound dehydrogenase-like protein